MLKKLRIQNFKGWKDTGIIRMSPITLFFGTNSSGKSSIGQFLMMLKQTVESSDRKAVFFPGGTNSAVQLGSYKEMVYRRKLENRIMFEYEWTLSSQLKFKDVVSGTSYAADRMEFSANVGSENDQSRKTNVGQFRYILPLQDGHLLSIGMRRTESQRHQYKVEVEKYPLKRNPGRAWNLGAPVRFYGFPDEVAGYHQNAEFVKNINFRHETLFNAISYIGPLRIKTDRLYAWSGITPESVGYCGENTVAALLASRGRKINTGYKKTTKPIEQIVAKGHKDMGLIEEFAVNPISEQRQEYEVNVRIKGSKEWVDLPDVGFGISQVLPVLVQCFYAPPQSIILMEQPEIHLHPSAQAALADVMIDVINSRENGKDRNIQLVIETHSEHFLRRLQRRIAEDSLAQEKISAYFADISKAPAALEPLQLDQFGNIQNWPDNFFGDEMGDITKQAKAAMNKRISPDAISSEDTK